MKYFLEEYWNNENFAIDYFFWHSIFHLITTEFEKCKLEYQKIIPDVNSKSKYFIDNYNVNFDEDLWEYLKSSYFMYKLDRKDIYNMKNENSFYNYLLNQYRKNLNKDNATGEKYE